MDTAIVWCAAVWTTDSVVVFHKAEIYLYHKVLDIWHVNVGMIKLYRAIYEAVRLSRQTAKRSISESLVMLYCRVNSKSRPSQMGAG